MTPFAKLTIPTLPESYTREVLYNLIARRHKPLGLWIAGLPGAGKTTAVIGYLARRTTATLWYRCDEGDKDPSTFFHYFSRFLQAEALAALPVFTAEYRADIAAFSRKFFRDLFSQLQSPVTLVLDNYQDASTDLVNEIMQYALDELPNGIEFIFISRTLPPAEFAKVCANGLIGVVTPTEMQLTIEEALAIGHERADGLSDQRIQQIFNLTEGWTAGMILFSALGGTTVIDLPLETLEPAALFNYFAVEVFKKLTPAAQHVLLVSSMLPLPTAQMAIALSGMSEAGTVLDNLFAQGYFITTSADSPRRFEFHPLFRHFLLRQAGQLFDAKNLSIIKGNAVQLLEDDGQVEAAIALYSTDVDTSRLAALLQKYGPVLIRQGRFELINTWLSCVSAEACQDAPWLQYWLAAARLPLDLRFSQCGFEKAFEQFNKQSDQRGIFASWAAAVNALCIDADGDYARLDPWLIRFDTLRLQYPEFPDAEIAWDVAFSMYYALYYRAPQDHRASFWRKQALSLATASDDPFKKASVVQRAVVHDLLIGNHARARLHMATFEALEQETKQNARITASIKYTQIYFRYRVGEFDAALAEMRAGLAIAEKSGYGIWVHHMLSHGAAAAISKQDFALADDLLQKLSIRIKIDRGFGALYFHVVST